jgi:ectoine hydroxylase-related dioxygenase (phytanoyl-CoA dioxygenase family)
VPTLSHELVARFHRDGYLRLETLADEGEVDRLRDLFDGVFADGAQIAPDDRVELADRGGALAQVLNPERYAPGLVETNAYRAAAAVARALLGDGAGAMGNHAILKPARDGAETPWHQDEAYWDPGFRHRAISIWTPLQPATAANGCMWFVPGSHAGASSHTAGAGAGRRSSSTSRSRSPTRSRASCPPAARPCTPAARCTTRARIGPTSRGARS